MPVWDSGSPFPATGEKNEDFETPTVPNLRFSPQAMTSLIQKVATRLARGGRES
jgi:hypothetical protein